MMEKKKKLAERLGDVIAIFWTVVACAGAVTVTTVLLRFAIVTVVGVTW